MTRHKSAALAAILLLVAVAFLLWAMGRPPICTCGTVQLWGEVGPEQSQMLADWYSPSHFIHGLIFYGLLWLFARKQPVERRFLAALIVEAAWEYWKIPSKSSTATERRPWRSAIAAIRSSTR